MKGADAMRWIQRATDVAILSLFVGIWWLARRAAAQGTAGPEVIGNLIGQVGLPVGLLIVILWFIAHYLWPFFTSQLEAAQRARNESQQEFLQSLHRLEITFSQHLERIASTLELERRSKGE